MAGSAAARRSWFDRLIDALAAISAALLCALVVLVLADVAGRSLHAWSLPWSFDAAEYMLYAITFLGTPWVLREEGHIAIELVVERLSPRPARELRRLTDLIGAVVCAILFYYACRVLARSAASGDLVQESFVFPEWYLYAGVPPIMLLLFGIFVRRVVRPGRRRGGETSDGI